MEFAATATPAASSWYCLMSCVVASARRSDEVLLICCDARIQPRPHVIARRSAMLPNPAVILVPIRKVAPRRSDRHIVNPTWTDSPCIGCFGWRGLTPTAARLRGVLRAVRGRNHDGSLHLPTALTAF